MSRKRILVTGGNRGIGKEICRQLAELGHEVILTARSAQSGEEAASEVGAKFRELDVSKEESVIAFSQDLKERGWRIGCINKQCRNFY